jgi:hypothetical protein
MNTLYTNDLSWTFTTRSKMLTDFIINSEAANNLSIFRYNGFPDVMAKSKILLLECDNIAQNWMTDNELLEALNRAKVALDNLNAATTGWDNVMHIIPLSTLSNNPS